MKQFTSMYGVTIGDINYGGHMGNERTLVIFQDARVRFLEELGCTETNIGDGLGIIMVEANVRYLREVFHGEELEIFLSATDIKRKGFTLHYSARRVHDGVVVFEGTTAFLTFDYDTRKVSKMPDGFKEKIDQYLPDSMS